MANKSNGRLAFGLCKKYGIEIQEGWTPKDAWDAIKKKTGKDSDEIYNNLSNELKEDVKPEKNKDVDKDIETLKKESLKKIEGKNEVKELDVSERSTIGNKVGGYESERGKEFEKMSYDELDAFTQEDYDKMSLEEYGDLSAVRFIKDLENKVKYWNDAIKTAKTDEEKKTAEDSLKLVSRMLESSKTPEGMESTRWLAKALMAKSRKKQQSAT